jgi:hypothetical protein
MLEEAPTPNDEMFFGFSHYWMSAQIDNSMKEKLYAARQPFAITTQSSSCPERPGHRCSAHGPHARPERRPGG